MHCFVVVIDNQFIVIQVIYLSIFFTEEVYHCANAYFKPATPRHAPLLEVSMKLWKTKIWCEWIQKGCNRSTWWRHQMESFSALLAICARKFTILQTHTLSPLRPSTRSLDKSFESTQVKFVANEYKKLWLFPNSNWDIWMLVICCSSRTFDQTTSMIIVFHNTPIWIECMHLYSN